jgi:hypothetical protein
MLALVAGCATTSPPGFDPNDAIYTGTPPPSDKWVAKFGDSDRTRLFFNAAVSRANDAALAKIVKKLNEDVEALKEQLASLSGADPNDQGTEGKNWDDL